MFATLEEAWGPPPRSSPAGPAPHDPWSPGSAGGSYAVEAPASFGPGAGSYALGSYGGGGYGGGGGGGGGGGAFVHGADHDVLGPARRTLRPGQSSDLRSRRVRDVTDPPASARGRTGADEDASLDAAQRYAARTYARFGLTGALRILPREALAELRSAGPAAVAAAEKGSPRDRRRPRRESPANDALSRFWMAARRFLSCPEKVLFLLLCLFAALVAWDTWRAGSHAHAAATLAAMHMTAMPFPAGR